ncbi:MAG: hypothetical protein R3E79_39610 [Caldilineaceae bacterium]
MIRNYQSRITHSPILYKKGTFYARPFFSYHHAAQGHPRRNSALPASPAPSTEPWSTLIKRWQYEDLTAEQAIGQLLLWGQYLHSETVRLQRLHTQLQQEVAALPTTQEG